MNVELTTGAAAAALAGATYLLFLAPRSSASGRIIFRGPRDGSSRVAVTFDDGPTPDATPRILDVLARLDAKAAFFVIGANAARHPDLLRRIDAEGHLVANHSYDHHYLGSFHGWDYWRDQLLRTDDTIAGIIGKRPALFRPPMGIHTWPIMVTARRGGRCVVTWTRRARDGRRPTTRDRILRRLLPPARGGDILMLHDGVVPGKTRDCAASIAVVEPLVTGLRHRGLLPVRLDELLALGPYR